MTISPTIEARSIVIKALKAAPSVTAKIPADRLYPTVTPASPAKPFGRYGVESVDPFRASCWRGGSVDGSYHVFVNKAADIPDPKAYAEQAIAAIADVLDGLPDCHVERTQMMEGTDADSWHGVVMFTMTLVEQL